MAELPALIASTDALGSRVEHAYDLNGNVVELGYDGGFDSVRTYDAANRLESISDPSGVITYSRDKLGQVRQVTHPNMVTTDVSFDPEGNIVSIDRQGPKANPTATLLSVEYTYTADDLVASRTLTTRNGKKTSKPGDPGNDGPETTSYNYDSLNRLIGSEVAGGDTASYTYDAVGNRLSYHASDNPNTPSPKDSLSVSYHYDDGDQLLNGTARSKNKATVTDRRYDHNGSLVAASTQRLNPKGKPVGKAEQTHYDYNLRNELIAAGHQSWQRDGLGRALVTISGKNRTEYIYDMSHVIEAVGDDAGFFIRDESQRLLSQTVGNNPKTEVLLTDLVGTVMGSVGSNGIPSKIATFADFGQYVGNQKAVSIFGFAGELHDIDAERIDFLARSYDPTVGRFLQRDRAGFDIENPATFHPYMYAFNAPTIYTDYLGNFGWSSVTKFVSDHKATIAAVAVGVAVGFAAVAGGATYRALDSDPNTRALDLSSITFDAVVGGTFGAAGPLVGAGTRWVATTQVGQRVAGSTAGHAVTSAVAVTRSAATQVTQRIATAARQRSADVSASLSRTLATSRDGLTTASNNLRVRAASGASQLRNRVFSPQSGRAATASAGDEGFLFRGTTSGYPGSPGTQRVGITPTTQDPVVASAFATHGDEFGQGVLQVARGSNLTGVKRHEGLLSYEKEIGLELLPTEFAERSSATISSSQARAALAEVGVDVPRRIPTAGDLSTFLQDAPALTPEQTQRFLMNLGL